MDRYDTNLDHLLKVAIKNHENGALNPKAQFNVTIQSLMERRMTRAQNRGQPVPEYVTEMDFLNDPGANPWVAWPLRLYDCAPITDGAACVLLVASELAHNFTGKPIDIAGTGQASGRPLHDADELTSLSAAKAAAALLRRGVGTAVIKLGAQGAYFANNEVHGMVSPFDVAAVDSVAAGDAFNGALAVSLAEGKDLEKSVTIACAAGALAVTQTGAQDSMPERSMVEELVRAQRP